MANDRDSAVQGQEVLLQIQYFDPEGTPIDPDELPSVEILDPNGGVVLEETNESVQKFGNGLYGYTFRVPEGGELSEWTDVWSATIDHILFTSALAFSVVEASSSFSTTTGPKKKVEIGDDPNIVFTQPEIKGINVLLNLLKKRLRSEGRVPVRDANGALQYDGYGELITESCDVFTNEQLVAMLCLALSEINSIPFFTGYTFADPVITSLLAALVVEGAYVYAIASISLNEAGKEWTISDNGVNFTPPQLSGFLQTHYSTWLSSWRDNVRLIKKSIRPAPRGLGSYHLSGSTSPRFRALRHLRGRRVF